MALKLNSSSGSITLSAEDGSGNVNISVPRAGFAATDPQLTDLAGLTPSDSEFIVGDGSNFITESGATARTSLGLGSLATQDSTSLSVSGGAIDGTTVGATTASTGNFSTLSIAGTAISATAAELNTLDGITATVAELNTLDGITATTAELNYTDGVTSSIQTQLDDLKTVPPVGTKTSSYTLTASDTGEYVQIGSGGSITIPDATFAEGDVVSLFNNTTGDITITCSITTAYLAGSDADVSSATLATRGVATILFISSTVCVITGNVS